MQGNHTENKMGELLIEIYQLLFIASICYLGYTFLRVCVKAYRSVILDVASKLKFSNSEQILIWVSMSIFIAYLV